MLNFTLPRGLGSWLSRWQVPGLGPDASDTVMHWPPTPARVLGSAERHAHKCLAKALAIEHPKGFLLAHVPMHKLVRVSLKRSYREWLARAGMITVDFAMCDEHGYLRSVVMLPVPPDQPRLARRRERLTRVLHAAGVTLTEWDRQWQNESAAALRCTLFPVPHQARPGPLHYVDQPQAR